MFDYCEKIKKNCPFSTKTNENRERWKEGKEEIYYCGMASSINRIDWMKECPLDKKKKKYKRR